MSGCNGSGVLVRTWTATDDCDNSSTCVQRITIEDTTPPVITCPADLTIECDEDIDPSNTGSATATDNCGPDNSLDIDYEDDVSGLSGCNGSGVLVRTWIATDDCDNSSTCVQRITIEDTTPPVITCPADLTIECDEDIDPSNTGSATATDNCEPDNSLDIDYEDDASGLSGCNGSGVLIRTWIATDDCDNSSTCVQRITIEDTTPPVITCPVDLTIECDEDIDPSNTGSATATDNCEPDNSLDIDYDDDASGLSGCNGSGVLVRTWTATDDCGNASSCEQRITIEDTTPPVITCPADLTIECDEDIDPSNTGSATATDNCGPDNSLDIDYEDDASGLSGCNGSGVLIRTWIATDDCDNSSTCVQRITIEDTTPPVITCPIDMTIECDQSTDPNLNGLLGMASATDNCTATNDITITYDDDASGLTGCNGTGVLLRTWTAEDACGLTSSCIQEITIEDTTPPVITCPANVTIECDEEIDPNANPLVGEATATDNCQDANTIDIGYVDDYSGLTGCNGTGTFIRTWTATDDCGNSSSCDQEFVVVDTTPPTVTCPSDITIECDESSDPDNTGYATAIDNCSEPNTIDIDYVDDASGLSGCNGNGTLQRTWVATDDCGNSSTCVQNITIVDTTPPVITCPVDLTIECDDSTDPSNTGTASATDNCTATNDITITYDDDASGLTGCNGTGVLVRTWVATDGCDNSSTCVQRITIEDNTPPVITCPTDVTIECDASDDPSATGSASATDNCQTTNTLDIDYSDDRSGLTGCNGTGVLVRTWTATDDCGNASSCEQRITIEDTTPPLITCPVDVTIECDESDDPSATGSASATDNCQAANTLDIDYNDDRSGLTGCNGTGVLVRTWTAIDDCGNASSCEQRITIEDTTPPVITCPADVTIECDESDDPSVTGSASATDNCQAANTIDIDYVDDNSGLTGCAGGGTIQRTWIATDDCGNSSTCVQNITIQDNTPPAITCPVDVTIECDESDDPSATGSASATDNCTAPNDIDIDYSDDRGGLTGCSGTGLIVRTWVAKDECGNSSTCQQRITVRDNTPPVITCPADVTIECDDSDDPSATGSASATDNCTAPNDIDVDYSDDRSGLTGCNGTGVLVRTWTATDDCGNSSTCEQRITVRDNTPPVITCPADVTIECDDSDDPSATGSASATDNCQAANTLDIDYSDDRSGLTGCNGTGVLVRTWTAIDDCGNASSCEQRITIEDTTPPIITCPVDVTIECDQANDPSVAGSASATDNCQNANTIDIDYVDDNSGLTGCAGGGTIQRTWIATDDCGNSSTCVQNITIQDNTPPAITCPVDVTIECDESDDPSATGSASATDNCTAPNDIDIDYSDDRGGLTGCSGTGLIVRTWVAKDECGNSSTCEQRITVRDNTPPVITCPVDVTIECDESDDPSATGSASATDNCTAPNDIDVDYSDDRSGLTGCNGTGVLVRTWTAIDDCGNSSTCEQRITVRDNTPPVITCPSDVTIECDESDDPSATGSASATDNCQAANTLDIDYSDDRSGLTGCNGTGVLVRTWTAIDDCGNASSCEQRITIEDTTPPVITCPVDVTIECDQANDPSVAGSASATDNCQAANTIDIDYVDDNSGLTGCAGGGTIQRTWIAIDDCGNSSTCVQNITIQDNTPPAITCPVDVTIECDDSDDPSATGSASATDNCTAPNDIDIDYSDNRSGLTGCSGTGLIVRTWVAEDACGNSSTCQQRITVRDNTPPVITCPVDVTIECDDSDDPSATGSASATDNCTAPNGIDVDYSDDRSGLTGCNGTGVLVRTWTAIDDCGNASSCEQRITIEDTTPPVITCPSDVTIECDEANDPSATGSASATDNCQAPNTLDIDYSDDRSGLTGCNGTGVLVRTWTATDDCGNASSCEQRITIEDTTPPVITCPVDVTIECDEANDPSSVGSATATDNCTASNQIDIDYVDDNSGLTGCAGGGTIQRTWIATDDCGNSSTCVQNITISDDTDPVITCPADVTVECDDSDDPSATGSASATDNCTAPDDIDIDYSDDLSGLTGCSGTGLIVRTWVAEDACGNSSTCQQRITVRDNTPPVITCPVDVTIECDDSDDPSTTGSASATDNCTAPNGIDVDYSDDRSGLTGCSGTGVLVRTWTAIDDCGNASSCEQRITIEDTTPPVITCPSDVTIECDESDDPSATGNASATDNCDTSPTVWHEDDSIQPGACEDSYTIVRVWIAEDDCGNRSTCEQRIVFEDTTPPVITCPVDVRIECDENNDPSNTGSASATDNCDDNLAITYVDNGNGENGCAGSSIQRTWIATDACGNSSTCVQYITIQDNTPPMIACPADVTINCTDSNDPDSVGEATATDNCDDDVDIDYVDDNSGLTGCAGGGTIQRTWIATDDCGNSSTCVQNISISDNTDPAITCPADVTVDCSDDTSPSELGYANATDNCDTDVDVDYEDDNSGLTGCSGTGIIIRTWIATDDCGNSATCEQRITVSDTGTPTITCPNDVTIECDESTNPANTGTATANDDCTQNVAVDYEDDLSGLTGCNGTGVILRIWTTVDDCGNQNYCEQRITLIDNTPPTISGIGPDLTISCGEDPNTSFSNPQAEDNCDDNVDLSYSDNQEPGNCAGYTISRVWTATDGCGNSVTVSQSITFEDQVTPTISNVGADVTIDCGDDPYAAFSNPAFDDDCDTDLTIETTDTPEQGCAGYTITRVWTATDDCGNSATASQTVTSEDNEAPVISGIGADITVDCGTNPTDAFDSPTVEDNCDPNPGIIFSDDEAQGCGGESITRTWIATDACGNTSSASQTISAIDNEAPVISGIPGLIEIDCGNDPDFGTPTVTDNCDDDPTLTFNDQTTPGDCPQEYTIIRTWTATDNCENVASTMQVIQVVDNQAPVFSNVPQDVTVDCENPNSNVTPIVSDNCDDDVELGFYDDVSENGCDSQVLRTWVAVDDCGNEASVQHTITIVDNDAPVFIDVPADATIDCENGTGGGFGTPTVEDNCDDDIELTYEDFTSGNGACDGFVTRVWNATDNCGNSSTAAQMITINDDEAPAFTTTLDDVTIDCGDNPNDHLDTPGVQDNCDDDVELTYQDLVDRGCAGNSVTRRWTATDDCGNTATLSQTVYTVDHEAPVFPALADVTVDCNDGGSGLTEPDVADNCDTDVTITYTDDNNGQGCDGGFTRTWVATDDCGNSSSAIQSFVITDDEAPVISGIGSDITIDCGTDPTGQFDTPTVSDNCDDSPDLTYSDDETDGCGGKSITRTWIANDACGNSSSASQSINSVDNEAPVISGLPGLIEVDCGNDPDFGTPTVTDNCDAEPVLTYDDQTVSGDCPQEYTIRRTWYATDDCDNSSSAVQIIQVVDNQAPVFSNVPQDLTVKCDGQVPSFGNPDVDDNCSDDITVTFEDSDVQGGDCDGYEVTRIWTATDECGNSSTVSATITLVDDAPPTIVVGDDFTINCDETLVFPDPVVEDDCDDEPSVTFADFDGTEGCLGMSITRIWRVTDACGNSTTASQTAVLGDTEAPVISGIPGMMTIDCPFDPDYNFGNATITDNCDDDPELTFEDEFIPGDCPQEFTVMRTWIATDGCGNEGTARQIIVVVDETAPTIGCVPEDITVECDNDMANMPEVNRLTVCADDNCDDEVDVVLEEETIPGNCPGAYTIIRRWTATDDCGNSATAQQIITVGDVTAPELVNVPADLTVHVNDGEEVPPVPNDVYAVDNCDEYPEVEFNESTEDLGCGSTLITRTWTATDECGNSAEASQQIAVIDGGLYVTANNNSPLCTGGTLELWASDGGNTYTWYGPDGEVIGTGQQITIPNVGPGMSGTYTVVAEGDDCEATATTEVEIDDELKVQVYTNAPVCIGDVLELWVDGGTQFQWDGPNGKTFNGQHWIIPNVDRECEGTYLLWVGNDSGCAVDVAIDVKLIDCGNECETPEITEAIVTDATCGEENGSIQLTVSPDNVDYTYTWDPANDDSNFIDGLKAGVYTVTITVTGDTCQTVQSFVVNETSGTAVIDSLIVNDARCALSNTGSVNFVVYYTTLFVGPADTMIVDAQGNMHFNGALAAGDYCLVIKDAHGCVAAEECFTIEDPDLLVVDYEVTHITCDEKGAIDLHISGGCEPYRVAWVDLISLGMPTPHQEDRDSLMQPGIYVVTVLDCNGCSQSLTIELLDLCDEPCDLVIDSVNIVPETCDDFTGSIEVFVSPQGDYTYEWSVNDSPNSSYLDGLWAGFYTVTVTSVSDTNCSVVETYYVPLNCGNCDFYIENVIIESETCVDGSGSIEVIVTPPGNYTYQWDPNFGSGNILDGLWTGTYSVTITDEDSCSVVGTFFVPFDCDNPCDLTIENVIITPETCADGDGSIEVIMTPPGNYTFEWDSNVGPGNFIDGLWTGTYEVTITYQDTCVIIESFFVPLDCMPGCDFEIEEVVIAPESCIGGSDGLIEITMTPADGNYHFEWDPTNPDSKFIDGLVGGIYTVTITREGDSCMIVESITVPGCECSIGIFGNDTLSLETDDCAAGATLCLDISFTDIYNYTTWNNGVPYDNFRGCDFDSSFSYSLLQLNLLAPIGPYFLEDWTVNGEEFSGPFNTKQELVDSMNVWDTAGDWVLTQNGLFISGGGSANIYGPLNIRQVVTNAQVTLKIDSGLIPHGTELTLTEGYHEIIIRLDSTGCSDTLYALVTCSDCVTLFPQPVVDMNLDNCDDTAIFCLNVPFDSLSNYVLSVNGEDYEGDIVDCDNIVAAIELPAGMHVVQLSDTVNACEHSVIVNVNCDIQPPCADTVFVIIPVDSTGTYCIDASACLDGEGISITNICEQLGTANVDITTYIDPLTDSLCISYTGITVGNDLACLEVCDDQGDCAIITLIVTVIDTTGGCDTLYAFNDTTTTQINTSVDIRIMANDVVPVNCPLIAMGLVTNPQNGSVAMNTVDETFTYTPNTDYCEDVDSFTYYIENAVSSDTATVFIEIHCEELIVYSGFSPNNDGTNDSWIIEGIEDFPNNTVLVFNRWGNQVYDKKGYTNSESWNGDWNDKHLPDGTYFYVIDDGEGNRYSGYVQIHR